MNTKKKVYECHVQEKLEKELGGKHHSCPSGVADVVTESELIEIKTWDNWKNALGQLIAYHVYFPDKNMRAHFFGTFPSIEKRIQIISQMTRNNIAVTWEKENTRVCSFPLCNQLLTTAEETCKSCIIYIKNNFLQFLDDNIEIVDNKESYITLTEMYGRYKDWFPQYYPGKIPDRQTFKTNIHDTFPCINRHFFGIKMKPISELK